MPKVEWWEMGNSVGRGQCWESRYGPQPYVELKRNWSTTRVFATHMTLNNRQNSSIVFGFRVTRGSI